MPVNYDIMKHKVIGPLVRQALADRVEIGLQPGLDRKIAKATELGEQQGRREILSALLNERFNRIPKAIEDRLKKATAGELNLWAIKLLRAKKLQDVFGE